jgi:RNA polymerase sigma-70 factor (ECF subfamily)
LSIQPLYPAKSPDRLPEERVEDPLEEFRPPATFDEIYETWSVEVAKWVRALGGPIADRDDLVQEVFVVVYRRLETFDGQNLAGWLYRITRSKVRDYRRLRWVKRVVLWEREPDHLATLDEYNPLSILATREKQALLSRLLDELSESERMAIVLFEVEGYSGQQIAELQGVPLNTVFTRIHNARKRLSQKLLYLESRTRKPKAQ